MRCRTAATVLGCLALAPCLSSGAPGAAGPLHVTVTRDLVTVVAVDVPLRALVDAVAAKTGVGVTLDPSLSHERRSLERHAAGVDDALRAIAAPHDAFMLLESQPDGGSLLRKAWIVPRGSGIDMQPLPVSMLAEQLDVQEGLRHDDGAIRLQALESARESGAGLEEGQLAVLALNDPSAAVRLLALQSLEGHPDAKRVAEALLYDADAHVRIEANGMLVRLGSSRHRR